MTLREQFNGAGRAAHVTDHLFLHQRYNSEPCADDFDTLAKAVAAGGRLWLRSGTVYEIDEPLDIPDTMHLIGAPGSVIRATAPMPYAVTSGNTFSLAAFTIGIPGPA